LDGLSQPGRYADRNLRGVPPRAGPPGSYAIRRRAALKRRPWWSSASGAAGWSVGAPVGRPAGAEAHRQERRVAAGVSVGPVRAEKTRGI
jgi:hypothetical protein